MNNRQKRLKKQLGKILADSSGSLRAAVAAEVLECGYEIETFFNDLLRHGCASGMIGSLIYYHDTHAFYDKHYHEIEEMRMGLEDSLGESLRPVGDLKNWYTWLAFEETARAIAEELGI